MKHRLTITTMFIATLLSLGVTVTLQAQTVTTLVTFNGTNGADPLDALIQGSDGNLYGTTAGAYFKGVRYPGTVFSMSPGGTLSTLATLGHEHPVGGLVQALNGIFYGTTEYGGTYAGGTIFAISATGKLASLYSACAYGAPCSGGGEPLAGLIQAADGNLYGTFSAGTQASSDGTIFKITPGGALTTLHVFNGADGADPSSGVIQASDGNFYGTTVYGGAGAMCRGYTRMRYDL